MLDKPKAFAWSYSKLKNFETCPRRYHAVDVEKTYGQEGPPSEALQRGDDLHSAMRGTGWWGLRPYPRSSYTWRSRREADKNSLTPYQIIQCELKLSTDKLGKPTGYFDKTTWLRTKIDYLRTLPTEREGVDVGHIVDYKTGKPPKMWDATQLLRSTPIPCSRRTSISLL